MASVRQSCEGSRHFIENGCTHFSSLGQFAVMAALVLILRTVMTEAAHLSTVINKWLSSVLSNKTTVLVFMCVQLLFEG